MATIKSEKGSKKTPKGGGHKYDASNISVLEGLEPVRKRPGMYIGSTGPDGLHHLVKEIFDNSRDEAMAGEADEIEIVLLPGEIVRVADNGRGIPVGIHQKTKVSALETVMTTLHAGGKFDQDSYKISGGLHGVGASVVNALSEWLTARVHRDGGVYLQEYDRGARRAKVKKIGNSKKHGTIITFKADAGIFSDTTTYNWQKLVRHMREQAYLVKGMRVRLIDAREAEFGKGDDANDVFWFSELPVEAPSQTFYFEGGLYSLVKFYNIAETPLHKHIFYIEKEYTEGGKTVQVEIALQYIDDIASREITFANNTSTPEGGTHLTGFRTALTRAVNDYAKKNNLSKGENGESFTGDDVREGLTAVISVKLPDPQFEGQTKAKLGSMEAQSATQTVFSEALAAFLEENPDDGRSIVGKSLLAMRARKAAKAAKDSVLRKGALDGMTLPGKLADCQSKKAEDSELFIVEGDSAGGCFSGDTKVALLDGRNASFKQLLEEQQKGKLNYCYTIGEDGGVAVALIEKVRITKRDAVVSRVTLDTGEEIVCTPDHRFMLRDGSYKEATALTTKDSLMPLYRRISRREKSITIAGYEMVYSQSRRGYVFSHLLVDAYNQKLYNLGKKQTNKIVHHRDFNKRNNNPDNLVRLDKQAHLLHHTRHLDRTLHSEESKEKARQVHRDPGYREKIRLIMTNPEMKKILSLRAKKQWENKEYKKFMIRKFLEFYETNVAYREWNNGMLNKMQREYWDDAENRRKQSEKVTRYFDAHPEEREARRVVAKKEWKNVKLKAWRAEKTREQWTPSFRARRRIAYNRTYLEKALCSLRDIYEIAGEIDESAYERLRRETNDKTLLRLTTIKKRFFSGDEERLREAVVHYNHKVKAVTLLKEKIDVYDFEVEKTHNFALASGVFVHNSAKGGRDRKTQAILPLRGKILNIERARLDKMLASEQVKNIIIALGTAIGDVFDVTNLRYHKLIIATDADVDGAHIRTLLLTLFYRHFRPLIEGGYVYIAQPPLYKIKKGKEITYAYSDEEKFALIGDETVAQEEGIENTDDDAPAEKEAVELSGTKANSSEPRASRVHIQRYKGLGEMNASELWETTMDPTKRILKQVMIEDAEEADKVFEMLMGSDVAPRKLFIQTHAKLANIDA